MWSASMCLLHAAASYHLSSRLEAQPSKQDGDSWTSTAFQEIRTHLTSMPATATPASIAAVAINAGMQVMSNISSSSSSSSSSSRSSNSKAPLLASKRSVVLHPEHGHHHLPHHHTEWELEMGLVIILVAVHVGALCFWLWLLYADKERKKQLRNGGQPGSHRPGSKPGSTLASAGRLGSSDVTGAAGSSSTGVGSSWRTPKELLAAWGKARERERLGKV
ncbi:hypothetical protein QJQ45_019349 [Haematococcus lacustris]|nr:hypothetical protein QJQ45_019349 [Haematococcus lacustris]